MSPLNTPQKRELSILAREAWMHAIERGDERDAEQFRRDEVQNAVGQPGLRCCDQSHFAMLMAHFHGLLGHVSATSYWITRAATEPQRIAMFGLKGAMAKTGTPWNYVDAICRTQFKVPLSEATPRQLGLLRITVLKRARKPHAEVIP
jgi:hypothetical protein